ncbi:MAG TPA: ABC transporter substrate-binding protein [Candidatus Angelobacter sp.]|nr:ABC transporter substrate-binding protein [Candidatus Angelobacter sp.]
MRVNALQPKKPITRQPGVTANSITIGSLAPLTGDNAETGNAIKALLTAYFDDLNQQHGGIYGRKVVLRFAESGETAAAMQRNAKRLAATPVFAMVAPFVPDAEQKLASVAQASKMPLVGLLALSVPTEAVNREVFYLLPGFQQLEQELVRFAATSKTTEKAAVVVADNKLQTDVAAAMQATWKELNIEKPQEFLFSAAKSADVVHDLHSQGIERVFFIGDGEQLAPWIQAADKAEWAPRVFVLGPLLDESILGAPARFQGRIFAAYPQLQPEVGAVDEFDYFLSSHNLASDHRLIQISAYCAAKILVEALARAGKNVTREKLIQTLEQMRDFRTGLLPGITFGANRRVGSFKAEIVCVDLASHSFQPDCSKTAKPE